LLHPGAIGLKGRVGGIDAGLEDVHGEGRHDLWREARRRAFAL
jgi:hypothetical protein